MKYRLFIFLLIPVFIPFGVIAEETNNIDFVISEYPGHTCSPPPKPIDPGVFKGSQNVEENVEQYNSEIAGYNTKVEEYNLQILSYRNCIQEYIGNAKQDIKKIKKKISEAINEANAQ